METRAGQEGRDTMTDGDEEVASEEPLYLHDGECWVADPEYLAHDSGVQGVIAIQFRDGGLWYLDGETSKWLNVEADNKPQRTLRPVQ
jgi:hypothetical protein